jgi:hypothetical protein
MKKILKSLNKNNQVKVQIKFPFKGCKIKIKGQNRSHLKRKKITGEVKEKFLKRL